MPNVRYNAQATGANDGSSWVDAFETLLAAVAATGQGDTIWGDKDSIEELDANTVYTVSGQRLVSVTPTANPPVDADYTPGLFIGDTDNIQDIRMAGTDFNSIGVSWTAGDDFIIGSLGFVVEEGTITIPGATDRLLLSSGSMTLINTDLLIGATSADIELGSGCNFTMIGGSVLGVATNLISRGGNAGTIIFEGVDLTTITSSIINFSGLNFPTRVIVRGCKLAAGVPVFSGSINSTSKVLNYGSSDTNKPYLIQEDNYYGAIVTETTNIKTGGASDGITPISLKYITSDKVLEFVRPLSNDLPILFYADTVGINTFEVDMLTDGVTLKDNEAWLDILSPGIDVQRVNATSRDKDAGNIPASPATWDTSGISAPVKQRISLQVDIKQAGWVEAHIGIAKPNIDVYVDVKLIDGIKQYLAGQAYINSGTATVLTTIKGPVKVIKQDTGIKVIKL